MTCTAHAPGKLFLTGEWAVLAGAPAVVAAVDRRAYVSVEPADAGVVVESLAEGVTTPLDLAPGAALPRGDAGAVAAVLRVRGAAPAGLRVKVDTRPFLLGERKLGLGRSAATLAAAAAALEPEAGRARVLALALEANACFQDGQGSGADVAAAIHGGLIEARRRDGALVVASRTLPAGLFLIAGWTGTAAPTAPLLARFAATRPPRELDELAAIATRAADAVARGDAAALLEAVDCSADLLERLGRAADVPIVTPALATLVRAAKRAGAAAKPSGAGAGDCGIALATSAAQAAAVRAAWQDAGILPLQIAIAAEGVTRG